MPRLTQTADGVYGVSLYRVNSICSLFTSHKRVTHTSVQVTVPTLDRYVGPALLKNLSRWVPQYWCHEVVARHWLPVTHATRMAEMARDLTEHAEGKPGSETLQRACQYDERKPSCGKLAVITGAGGGIDRCVALELAEQGAAIVVVDIRVEDAEYTVKLIHLTGDKAWAHIVDVGNAEQMEALVDWVGKELGDTDITVNNADIGMAGGIVNTSECDQQRILHVNMWDMIHGARLFTKQMVACGQGRHILNTASATASAPSRDLAAYATTKVAVLMFSECMRGELAGQDIGVLAIHPGSTETGITASTVYSSTTEAQQTQLRARVTKLYQPCGLKPGIVAKAISGMMQHNRPVVTIGIEAHLPRLTSHYAQWLSRLIARVGMAGHWTRTDRNIRRSP